MIIRDASPTHKGRNYWNSKIFGQGNKVIRCVGTDDSSTGQQDWVLRLIQHVENSICLEGSHTRFAHRQRLVGIDIKIDFSNLDIKRQVNQDRATAARAHTAEGLGKSSGNLRRFENRNCHFGDRFRNRGDIHALELFLIQHWAGCLAGDAQDRD